MQKAPAATNCAVARSSLSLFSKFAMAASKCRSATTARPASSSVRISAVTATNSVPIVSRPAEGRRTGHRLRSFEEAELLDQGASDLRREGSSAAVRFVRQRRIARRHSGRSAQEVRRLSNSSLFEANERPVCPSPAGGPFLHRRQAALRCRRMLQIHQFPCLSDNYGFLLHDPDSGETAAIDTPDASRISDARPRPRAGRSPRSGTPTGIPIMPAGTRISSTRPAHGDRPARSRENLRHRPVVAHGDTVSLGAHTRARHRCVRPHERPHRLSSSRSGIAFVGDSVFALGCGRMFEGEPEQFWASLERIKALPADTTLYCAHEYTAANAKFALHADPDNAALRTYVRRDHRQARTRRADRAHRAGARAGDQSVPARRRSGAYGKMGRRCSARDIRGACERPRTRSDPV